MGEDGLAHEFWDVSSDQETEDAFGPELLALLDNTRSEVARSPSAGPMPSASGESIESPFPRSATKMEPTRPARARWRLRS